MAADGVAVSMDEPDAQKRYWLEHSRDLTMEAVLFDSQAADIDTEERPEVISLLPAFEGKSVLELGAGIGRLTGEFAKCAGKVVAVDFIESMTKKNETINGHFKNASFICADVRSPELNFEDESLDLIFSNWLLMYLTEAEVKSFAERMLKWVKVGGFIFFRESCFHQSGDAMRKVNPTYYREPRFYSKVFQELHLDDGHNSAELSLVTFKRIKAYVKKRGDQNQICWLWQKVGSTSDRDLQKFVDNVPYTSTRILRYERVFGQGFVSPGGIDVTREFVKKLDLKPGQKVLDVGCGTGGADFYMAENFDVEVLGIDLSINMLSFAFERAMGCKCTVEFEFADCTNKDYPENTFDVIYSRDTILHIQFQDKLSLFRRFHKWLKPGGKVLISDYCRSTETPSKGLQEYIEQGGYDMLHIESYGKLLKNAGFIDVMAEDRTNQFLELLRRELDATEKNKQEFIHDFSEEGYDDIVNNWKGKLQRSSAGEQRWGLFIALKK